VQRGVWVPVKEPFKPLGVLAVVGGLSVISLVLNNWISRRIAPGGHDLSPVLPIGLYLIVVGVGLLYRRKWAAVVLAVPSALFGLWFAFGSLLEVPMPWELINLAFAPAFFIPAYVAIRRWSDLSDRWL
jgi:hypothetical protein